MVLALGNDHVHDWGIPEGIPASPEGVLCGETPNIHVEHPVWGNDLGKAHYQDLESPLRIVGLSEQVAVDPEDDLVPLDRDVIGENDVLEAVLEFEIVGLVLQDVVNLEL